MQKIITLVSGICIVIILVIACTVNEGIYGRWVSTSPNNVFAKDINIVKLRTKEGANFPYYTLIYDENFHASACQKDDNNQNICISLLLKTTNIHPTDEISSVVAAPFEGKEYILNTRLEYKLGYTLLYWEINFPQYNKQKTTLVLRRNWF